ncbi:dTDP-glucose 4,6-dehydratase [Tannockella kyphosi]|uniref:dTDP-glucose 4,6-dehydratase n=1 Tax=Tannockella kyphosi TaxID=2899121 RepID=UPI0020111213|nr:dTDP-glucose 4,6-dehydratase [Tannockella kyphosi]
MKIIVTGGAGFIGSNFVLYMLDKYPTYQVIVVDSLTYAGNIKNLESVRNNPNFHFIHASITNKQLIDKVFVDYKPDIIVNFAAESHVDRSIEDATTFLETNVIGTNILLDACLKYGISRYHQISTDEVYGDLSFDKPNILFNETTPLNPSSPYSVSKASADMLVQAYHRTHKLPVTISRSSNNYGPYQFPEKLIPLMITNALLNKPLPIYGNGENRRDWIYVVDHCKAIDKILHQGIVGQTYNIGGNQELTNKDVVLNICNLLNKEQSSIIYVEDRKGHDLRYAIDNTKINQSLNWYPETSFNEGLKKTVSWYLENKEWWQDILSKTK